MNSDKFKNCHFPKAIVMSAVYWYLRYSLSYRDIEELMNERDVNVDHSTVQRWVIKYTGIVEEAFRKKKKSVEKSWRMDETYIKVKGKWHYLYRAVDKEGNTIDFLLSKRRDGKSAKKFFVKAIDNNGLPEKITIDKSGANKIAIEECNSGNKTSIEIRQIKYLNNIVEQDHRGIKRIIRPMLGFKEYCSASITLGGIELVRMIKKDQLKTPDKYLQNPAKIFYSLVV